MSKNEQCINVFTHYIYLNGLVYWNLLQIVLTSNKNNVTWVKLVQNVTNWQLYKFYDDYIVTLQGEETCILKILFFMELLSF